METRYPHRRGIIPIRVRTASLCRNATTIPQINAMASLHTQARANRSRLRRSRDSLNSLASPGTTNSNTVAAHQRASALCVLRLTNGVVGRASLSIVESGRDDNEWVCAVYCRPGNGRCPAPGSGCCGCAAGEHEHGACACRLRASQTAGAACAARAAGDVVGVIARAVRSVLTACVCVA